MSGRVRRRLPRPPRSLRAAESDIPDMVASTAPRRRQRIQARHHGDEGQPIVVESASHSTSSCIDLTSDVQEDEFVDLTNVSGVIESPVVIMSSSSDPERRSTRSGRRGDEAMSTEENDDLPVFDLSSAEEATGSGDQGEASNNDSILSTPGRSVRCPICFDSSKTIRSSGRRLMSTTCGHIFCSECIQGSVDAQKRCPTCRRKLTMRQVHQIFL